MAVISAVILLQYQRTVCYRYWRQPVLSLCRHCYSCPRRLCAQRSPLTFLQGAKFMHCVTASVVRNPGVNLWDEYSRLRSNIEAKQLPNDRDPLAVYANNELKLSEIDVYGFDYDYTVACYSEDLDRLIYDMSRRSLIKYNKYPSDIENHRYDYDPSFAIRGLHCDVDRGNLLKIDAFHNIQMGAVYHGMQQLSNSQVRESYGGTHVSIEDLSLYGIGPKLFQLMDMFALPEMTLYANIVEFFNKNDITYCPEHVFFDVRNNVRRLHETGEIHQAMMRNLDQYLVRPAEILSLFRRLSAAGKKLFLITNSGTEFVDKGMTYLVGHEWCNLFDIVITNARKPKFFTETARPFRMYDHKRGVKSWNKINKLVKGCIYQEGNFSNLLSLTGWTGNKVLYIGDHVYTDLADATLKLGWRTGAIITELEDEINTINTETYKKAITWTYGLEALISKMQVYDDAESQQIIAQWKLERERLREEKKVMFNERFGSLFRTYHNPTYFSRRLCRFADVYTSSIVNFLKYPLNYTFYPQRTALPHELMSPDRDITMI